jgi:hypothetical protein
MHVRSGRPLLFKLASHTAMGAGLGILLSLSLIVGDAHQIFQMIVNSAMPHLVIAVLVALFASLFAVGASLTGLIFILMERD